MAAPRRVLVVDDDARIRNAVGRALEGRGLVVDRASSGPEALSALARAAPELVLTDVRMPGMSGLELLGLLRERRPEIPVILMSGHDDLPVVATAMGDGATDFLVKPFDLDELWVLVQRLAEDRAAAGGPTESPRGGEPGKAGLVGSHPQMVEAYKLAGRVSRTSATVLIRGESGVGKELLARTIHDRSPRAREPFVAVNCTSLPDTLLESELFGHVKGAFTGAAAGRRGRFAMAGAGTILLDEIGDTGLAFQAKLLRVLQEREFHPVGAESAEPMHARVIAATHVDLEDLVARGSFRHDLYYRLRVVEIDLPPLRDRREDVPALAAFLVEKAAGALGIEPMEISPVAMQKLQAHSWPGNVRELENSLTRALLMARGRRIVPGDLNLGEPLGNGDGKGGVHAPSALASLDEVERAHVERVLLASGGVKKRAAEILGVSRPRLDRLMARHGIVLPGG